MRLFQNSGIYPAYLPRLNRLAADARTFEQRRHVFLADRYGACHFLKPVLDASPDAFFTNGDDERLQQLWAREQGMVANAAAADILLGQIEHHRSEVFYNLDPMRFGADFLKRLPGHVKVSLCWRAAPSAGGDFRGYRRVLGNFPGILRSYESAGLPSAYFAPAHDPAMDRYGVRTDRPIDVLFVGGYSRHHQRRATILEAVAELHARNKLVYCLDRSRLTRLAETPAGLLPPLRKHRRPKAIRAVSQDPVFGLDLYDLLSKSKIVLNAAIDMAGEDRGNMRCFEAMGCGALMVSDNGRYPDGMNAGETFLDYDTPAAAKTIVLRALSSPGLIASVAASGHRLIRERYSKESQWTSFLRIVEQI